MKWSANQTPSQPVAAACFDEARISGQGCPAPGQNENRTYRPIDREMISFMISVVPP